MNANNGLLGGSVNTWYTHESCLLRGVSENIPRRMINRYREYQKWFRHCATRDIFSCDIRGLRMTALMAGENFLLVARDGNSSKERSLPPPEKEMSACVTTRATFLCDRSAISEIPNFNNVSLASRLIGSQFRGSRLKRYH